MKKSLSAALTAFCLMWATDGKPSQAIEIPSLCTARKAARIPLLNETWSLVLPALGNGQPMGMILDTGAEGSLLTPEALIRLHLRPDDAHSVKLAGSDGAVFRTQTAILKSLTLGVSSTPQGNWISLPLGETEFPVHPLPSAPQLNPPVLGLAGANMLAGYDVEVRPEEHSLTLWEIRSHSPLCAVPPFWEDNGQKIFSLPASLHNGRYFTPFRLDGYSGKALIDTGARSRILSASFARKLALTDERLNGLPGGITAGISGRTTLYHWARFKKLSLGNSSVPNPVLTVTQLGRGVDLLLGADWVMERDLWLSPSVGRIFFRSLTAAEKSAQGGETIRKPAA